MRLSEMAFITNEKEDLVQRRNKFEEWKNELNLLAI
jgi:hypothetical protein